MNPERTHNKAASNSLTSTQYKMDRVIGYTLQTGVLLSLTLVTAGMLWQWLKTGRLRLDDALRGMNLFHLATEQAHLVALGHWEPRLLVNLGVIMLMLTPYARVLVSAMYFMVMLKNWKYSLVTSIVFAVLTYSLFIR